MRAADATRALAQTCRCGRKLLKKVLHDRWLAAPDSEGEQDAGADSDDDA